MGGIKQKQITIGLLAMGFLFWLCSYAAGAASGSVYYDSQGNIISAEEFSKLTGKPQPPGSPKMVVPSGAETVQPEKQSAPETPVDTVPPASEGALKSGENLPATEKKPGEPISPSEEPVSATSSADREPAQYDVPEKPLYEMTLKSDTLFRVFQRNTERKDDSLVMPLYEYLQIDLDPLEEGLSLHTFGWGRQDLSDSKFYQDNPEGELLYGYIQYKRPDYGLNLKLGRQHVFDGILNSSLDGLGIKSTLTSFFDVSLYGGSPVALASDQGRSGDSIWGGRIAGHIGSRYEIGFSYMLENSDGDKDGEQLGVDFSVTLPGNAYLHGQSAYNLDTQGWGKHFYEGGLDLGDFHFRPVFERYQYADYFNQKVNSADPFRFLAGTDEILTVLGSDILWHQFRRVDLGAKVMHYGYDLRNDNAMYYEGNLVWYLKGLSQVGGQLGRMDGGTAETAYYLTRGFFYWNRPLEDFPLQFVTGDVVYVHYDEEIYGKDSSLFLSLGTGARFFNDTLEVKLSGDFSRDPYFNSDLRGMLTITYRKTVQTKSGRDTQGRQRQ